MLTDCFKCPIDGQWGWHDWGEVSSHLATLSKNHSFTVVMNSFIHDKLKVTHPSCHHTTLNHRRTSLLCERQVFSFDSPTVFFLWRATTKTTISYCSLHSVHTYAFAYNCQHFTTNFSHTNSTVSFYMSYNFPRSYLPQYFRPPWKWLIFFSFFTSLLYFSKYFEAFLILYFSQWISLFIKKTKFLSVKVLSLALGIKNKTFSREYNCGTINLIFAKY